MHGVHGVEIPLQLEIRNQEEEYEGQGQTAQGDG